MSRRLLLLTACLGACAPGPLSQATRGAGSPRVAEIVRAGENRYWSGELDSARALFQEALAAAELAGDSLAKARLLTWLGLTAFRSGEPDEARTRGVAALALTMRIGDPEEVFRATNLLGLLAWRQGRLAEADSLFRRAKAAADQARDEDGASRALGNLRNRSRDGVSVGHIELDSFDGEPLLLRFILDKVRACEIAHRGENSMAAARKLKRAMLSDA